MLTRIPKCNECDAYGEISPGFAQGFAGRAAVYTCQPACLALAFWRRRIGVGVYFKFLLTFQQKFAYSLIDCIVITVQIHFLLRNLSCNECCY
jgi:hypothetical protein